MLRSIRLYHYTNNCIWHILIPNLNCKSLINFQKHPKITSLLLPSVLTLYSDHKWLRQNKTLKRVFAELFRNAHLHLPQSLTQDKFLGCFYEAYHGTTHTHNTGLKALKLSHSKFSFEISHGNSFSTMQITCCVPKVTPCNTGATCPCLEVNSNPQNCVNPYQTHHGCSICAPKHHSYFVSALWRFSEPETCLQNQGYCWFNRIWITVC